MCIPFRAVTRFVYIDNFVQGLQRNFLYIMLQCLIPNILFWDHSQRWGEVGLEKGFFQGWLWIWMRVVWIGLRTWMLGGVAGTCWGQNIDQTHPKPPLPLPGLGPELAVSPKGSVRLKMDFRLSLDPPTLTLACLKRQWWRRGRPLLRQLP